jgi:hypothetical protein
MNSPVARPTQVGSAGCAVETRGRDYEGARIDDESARTGDVLNLLGSTMVAGASRTNTLP